MRLLSPLRIGSLELPNRLMKSAMEEARCDKQGAPTQALLELYERWAQGGTGLLITGMTYVRQGFGFTEHDNGIYTDELIPAWRRVTELIHRYPSKVFMQLCWAQPQLPRRHAKWFGRAAVSAGFNKTNLLYELPLCDQELKNIISDMVLGARRARDAGFDGIQLHGAHGYLISRLLSPKHNRRHDAWGGDFSRRLHFLDELLRQLHISVGKDFPVAIKMNATDGEAGGLTLTESIEIARHLESLGVDGLEISAGTGDVGLGVYPNRGRIPIDLSKRFISQNFPELRPFLPLLSPILRYVGQRVALTQEAYFAIYAQAIAEAVHIPVACVGGIRSLERAEALLNDTAIAQISLGRPLLCEPGILQRWQEGQTQPVHCCSCNECFVALGLGEQLYCRHQPHTGQR